MLAREKKQIKPLLDIMIDSMEGHDSLLQDNHFHFNVKRDVPNKITHLEISECIKILNNARKNLPSYKTMKNRQEQIEAVLHAGNLVYIAGLPAAMFIFMLSTIGYLTSIRNSLLAPALMSLSMAKKAYDDFMQAYKAEIDELNSTKSYSYLTCIENIFPGGIHGLFKYDVDCFQVPVYQNHGFDEKAVLDLVCYYVNYYPKGSKCHQDILCEKANLTIACWDKMVAHNVYVDQLINQYIAQQADEKSNLEKSITITEKNIQIIKEENPGYDMSSMIMAVVTGSIFLLFGLYLWTSRQYAYFDYKNELHPLNEGLNDSNHIHRIINLSSQLNININDISIEKLKEVLEYREPFERKKHAFTFFSTVREVFPDDKKVVNHICETAYRAGLISFT